MHGDGGHGHEVVQFSTPVRAVGTYRWIIRHHLYYITSLFPLIDIFTVDLLWLILFLLLSLFFAWSYIHAMCAHLSLFVSSTWSSFLRLSSFFSYLLTYFLTHSLTYLLSILCTTGNIEDWLCDLLKKMQLTMKDLARSCSHDVILVQTDLSQLRTFIDHYISQFALLGEFFILFLFW